MLNSNITDIFTKLTGSLNNLNTKVNNIEEKINSNNNTANIENNKNINTISGDLKVDLNLIHGIINKANGTDQNESKKD